MRERHLRVVAAGGAVHERRRSEGRRADQIGADDERRARPDEAVGGAQVHQQIVRVLVVDERDLVVAFAGLKQLRRTLRVDGEGLDRDHRHHGEAIRRPHGAVDRQHAPVLRLPGRHVDEAAILAIEPEEDVAVPRPAPRRRILCPARGRKSEKNREPDQERSTRHRERDQLSTGE